ncbi:hypothetical protein Rrhod_3755 [Rhodococcus rhodnii LMG 5362]|uniref:Uncharacterized protein n=1 Tax=Rhodococcus rhodnii LMG 5362 TaxID=1273125 RepID=R7WI81_9NOCA|nr:hypothetical protein Rrhod_3755 [Rhodococcus rhodnii LMG 5362]
MCAPAAGQAVDLGDREQARTPQRFGPLVDVPGVDLLERVVRRTGVEKLLREDRGGQLGEPVVGRAPEHRAEAAGRRRKIESGFGEDWFGGHVGPSRSQVGARPTCSDRPIVRNLTPGCNAVPLSDDAVTLAHRRALRTPYVGTIR